MLLNQVYGRKNEELKGLNVLTRRNFPVRAKIFDLYMMIYCRIKNY